VSTSVPFLKRDYIESEAEGLLASYGKKYGRITKPPIPADEILNTFLRVTLDFDDLPKLLGVGTDVFGATWIERGQVIIDQNLDPTNHPERIGRYNFTIGHETGHWQLHRPYLLKNPDQESLFEREQRPTVICRTSEAKDPIEWQADFFSACLLMPKVLLREWWNSKPDMPRPITIAQIREAIVSKSISTRPSESDDLILDRFVAPMARDFEVSPIAMRIRLETLGFIVREEWPSLFGL
jgi:Zn-dependent peptidase ImmA (M78 family)